MILAESVPIALDLPPGVVKTRSGEGAKGRWYDALNVRFKDGKPEKRAGHETLNDILFEGRARGMKAWNTVKGLPLYGLGTNLKIYGSTDGINPIDITPLRFPMTVEDAFSSTTGSGVLIYKDAATDTGTLTNPFTTTNASPTITVAHTAHGHSTGDKVYYNGATAVGGTTPNGGYVITVVNANSYTITYATNASSGATGGGTVTFKWAKYLVGTKLRFYGNSWNGGTQVGGVTLSREYEILTIESADTYKIIANDKKATLTNPFTTTNTSTTVTVADTAHGRATGDLVYYTGATAVGGQTPAGEYTLTKVDDNSYTIVIAAPATSGATGGGTVTRYFTDKATSTVANTGTVGVVRYVANPFTTTNGQSAVAVHLVGHGAQISDRIVVTGASPVGGIPLNGEFRITAITDVDNFVIDGKVEATSGATGGGAAVLIEQEISPGPADKIIAKRGFGKGSFGFGAFGSTVLVLDPVYYDPRSVAVDNIGEDAIFTPLGGNIYYWDSSEAGRAEVIPNAPTQLRYAFMTEERFLHALGINGDPLLFGWASQDSINEWEVTAQNTANSGRRVREGSKLVAGTAVSNGVNLIWTDTATYVHQYTGSSFIYDTKKAASNAGLIGPQAFCLTPIGPFWMSQNKFFYWNGAVTEVPNSIEMANWIFDQIDVNQRSKCFLLYDPINDAVYVYYVPMMSGEPSRYAIIDVRDFSWVNGEETRTTGTSFDEGEKNPLMTGINGKIYKHEVGLNADGAAAATYIEYAPLEFAKGEVWTEVLGIDPNFKRQVGDVGFEITTYDRNENDIVDDETVQILATDQMTDMRVSGRRHMGRFSQTLIDGDFSIDTPILDAKPMGRRR